MTTCKPLILLEETAFYITQCQHCQRIGLIYNNLVLGFKHEEFIGLCQTLDSVNFDQSSVLLPDGQPYLIIKTGHPDIQLSLSKVEYNSFRAGLQQALRRMNLHQLLRLQSN
ncbi:DUF6686 family protein [Spirosoma aerolatum]|uniref:DUF6686 family protein n=1 Tax=Spirosoma aerolatum TaxID=1211326 RepID=UPI0009AD34C0|nr:DUF6686 family protein [Spirosoma aerolatum]